MNDSVSGPVLKYKLKHPPVNTSEYGEWIVNNFENLNLHKQNIITPEVIAKYDLIYHAYVKKNKSLFNKFVKIALTKENKKYNFRKKLNATIIELVRRMLKYEESIMNNFYQFKSDLLFDLINLLDIGNYSILSMIDDFYTANHLIKIHSDLYEIPIKAYLKSNKNINLEYFDFRNWHIDDRNVNYFINFCKKFNVLPDNSVIDYFNSREFKESKSIYHKIINVLNEKLGLTSDFLESDHNISNIQIYENFIDDFITFFMNCTNIYSNLLCELDNCESCAIKRSKIDSLKLTFDTKNTRLLFTQKLFSHVNFNDEKYSQLKKMHSLLQNKLEYISEMDDILSKYSENILYKDVNGEILKYLL